VRLNFSAFARCMTSRIPASDRSAAMPGMRLRERLAAPAHYVPIAALAMGEDMAAAPEALATVLELRPDFSVAWLHENMPWTGDIRALA
jgi:hypothetical protein